MICLDRDNLRSPVDQWVADCIGIPIKSLSKQVLEEYQLDGIRACLKLVKEKSRFYKETLRDVNPEDIKTMEDFRCLPTCSEKDLIDQEWQFQCVDSSEIRRVVTVPTTGTTGKQKRIRFTTEDIVSAMSFAPTGFAVMCVPGDKVLVMMSGGFDGSIGDNIAKGLEPLGTKVQVYGPIDNLERAAKTLLEEMPDVIVGMPLQILTLARYMQLHHMPFTCKSVLLSADDVPDSLCQRIRRTWSSYTFRHYGMTELCMFGAVECMGQDGYHIRSCDHYFEILDPDDRGFGEITITSFRHQGMPLIRYRTGDIGRMTDEICKCGSPLPRLASILGRRKNQMQFIKGSIFLGELQDLLFQFDSLVDCKIAYNSNKLEIEVSLLKGDFIDLEKVEELVNRLPALQDVRVIISAKEMEADELPPYRKKGLLYL